MADEQLMRVYWPFMSSGVQTCCGSTWQPVDPLTLAISNSVRRSAWRLAGIKVRFLTAE